MKEGEYTKKEIHIIGCGSGSHEGMTGEAYKALEEAEVIIGSKRLCRSLSLDMAGDMVPADGPGGAEGTEHRKRPVFHAFEPKEILRIISNREEKRFAYLVSGDVSFYSGARGLMQEGRAEGEYEFFLYPGISSLSLMAARLGLSLEDGEVFSLHGRGQCIYVPLAQGRKIFLLGDEHLGKFLEKVRRAGWGFRKAVVASCLGTEEERIFRGSVEELAGKEYDALSILCILPQGREELSDLPAKKGADTRAGSGATLAGGAVLEARSAGLADEAFIRGRAPMTKSEVRALIMSRLSPGPEDVVYDIGAGTGSVSVECAMTAMRGKVYALEEDQEALDLLQQNRERFLCENMEVIPGEATKNLQDLPSPDVVFIGGSNGHFKEILSILTKKNPALRLVMSAVTPETLSEAAEYFPLFGLEETECSQVSVTRWELVSRKKGEGRFHMPKPQNGVYILSARGKGTVPQVPGPKIMFSALHSGSGKTMMTCAFLNYLKKQGCEPIAFKCGPDYIDPLYHRKVLGLDTGNLDSFFMEPDMLRSVMDRESAGAPISVLEGVMGYYDGIGGSSRGSSAEIAQITKTPVVLVVDGSGAAATLLALIRGMRDAQPGGRLIRGVIFNRISENVYSRLAGKCEEMGIRALGYIPKMGEYAWKSRHLGLVTPEEIRSFSEELDQLTEEICRSVDMEGLCRLAGMKTSSHEGAERMVLPKNLHEKTAPRDLSPLIAISRDEAFCFYYRENLEILEELGGRICFFSPLRDEKLPECGGLILTGGYPELHGEALAQNRSLMEDIRQKISRGLPTIAECGGYLYLHEHLIDAQGRKYPMVGLIPGDCRYEGFQKKEFGYMLLRSQEDTLLSRRGEVLKAHEYHYCTSEAQGDAYEIRKASDSETRRSCMANDTLYAGFPHIPFAGNTAAAERFVQAVLKYVKRETD